MSAFKPEDQIISIYYFVEALEPIKVPIRSTEFEFDDAQMAIYKERGETETFRYISLDKFSADSVTLPIDKVVANMLKQQLSQ
jgi:hypothetical protein